MERTLPDRGERWESAARRCVRRIGVFIEDTPRRQKFLAETSKKAETCLARRVDQA